MTPRSPSLSPAPTHPGQPFRVEVGGLAYEVDELPSRSSSRTVVSVSLAAPAPPPVADSAPAADTPAPRLIDRVDLFSFGSRRRFAQLVASHFGREPDACLGQLALVLDHLERARAATESPEIVELTPERRQRAAALLRASDLLDRAALAMDALGLVGEEATKRLAYLVVTSRLLDRPLSAVLSAPTSSGKSALMGALARLLPPESVELLSRLTPQALFYAGPNALRHKVLLVDEHAGAREAEHSLRTLLSNGSLTLRSAPRPGGGAVSPITVHGPIALLSGTTGQVHEEHLTRCLELCLDESPAQTERVQAAQAAASAGQPGPRVDLEVWRDAQRLLESADVVVPYAPRLRFPARTSHDRRDHQKLLALIMAHALLHQRQRQRDDQFRVVATPADYAAVHRLVTTALRVELQGLSSRAARAYAALAERPAQTRRELAVSQGWAYNTAKKALAELLDQELARRTNETAPARYALVDRALLGGPGALLDPCELEQEGGVAPQARGFEPSEAA